MTIKIRRKNENFILFLFPCLLSFVRQPWYVCVSIESTSIQFKFHVSRDEDTRFEFERNETRKEEKINKSEYETINLHRHVYARRYIHHTQLIIIITDDWHTRHTAARLVSQRIGREHNSRNSISARRCPVSITVNQIPKKLCNYWECPWIKCQVLSANCTRTNCTSVVSFYRREVYCFHMPAPKWIYNVNTNSRLIVMQIVATEKHSINFVTWRWQKTSGELCSVTCSFSSSRSSLDEIDEWTNRCRVTCDSNYTKYTKRLTEGEKKSEFAGIWGIRDHRNPINTELKSELWVIDSFSIRESVGYVDDIRLFTFSSIIM